MITTKWVKHAIIPSAHIENLTTTGLRLSNRRHILLNNLSVTNPSYFEVRAIWTIGKMMVDIGGTDNRAPVRDMPPEKVDDGGFASGRYRSEDGKLRCGYSSFRGKRVTMEDFYDVKMSRIDGQRVCLFGIFDGHGGSRAAEYLRDHLFENLMKHPKFMTDTKAAISETYKQTDSNFLDSEKDNYRDDGSTASTAVLVGNRLYVANVGDSRTVGSKAGKAIPLSEDHKPNRSDERKRIESAGGIVMWAGTWRVGGVLAMSRAFGNRMLKQFVVAEPEIQEQEINEELELLVLASDGLWDVVPNEDAVCIAQREEEPETAARKLTETAFTWGSADNITCIVVKFQHDHIHPADILNKTKTTLDPAGKPSLGASEAPSHTNDNLDLASTLNQTKQTHGSADTVNQTKQIHGSADTVNRTKPTYGSSDAVNQTKQIHGSADTLNQTKQTPGSADIVNQTKPRISAANIPSQAKPDHGPGGALNQPGHCSGSSGIQHK